MSKKELDSLMRIETSLLKKGGYFTEKNITKTGLLVVDEPHGAKGEVAVVVSTIENFEYLEVTYVLGGQERFNCRINLISIPCHFGGVRYRLVCPGTAGEVFCGKHVEALYLVGDYFACRHCHNLTHASNNINKRTSSYRKRTQHLEDRAMKQMGKIKRGYYGGKPTRQKKKLDDLITRAENLPR